jgi:Integral membrane protein
MSASISHPSITSAPAAPLLRFGAESGSGEYGVQWLLKRNCSSTPRQLLKFYVSLSVLSLGVALVFWAQGATLVMPFAGFEVLAVGVALLVHARHATDRESIRLQAGRLTVEHVFGRHVERAEFLPAWVRVEPVHGERSLIELSGQGQRIAVGRFVRPELRQQLAEELRWALRRWQWMPAPGSRNLNTP